MIIFSDLSAKQQQGWKITIIRQGDAPNPGSLQAPSSGTKTFSRCSTLLKTEVEVWVWEKKGGTAQEGCD
jgi:hypothetical protein